MAGTDNNAICISGVGVTAAIGQGQAAFIDALLNSRHAFDIMQRPGRKVPEVVDDGSNGVANNNAFIGAEIADLMVPDTIEKRMMRNASHSAQVGLVTLDEAWRDARLDEVDPYRIGLIIGGSNFQQRELVQTQSKYLGRSHFLRPTYGMQFMDSDICGLCSEQFGIQGFAYTLGSASASGQVAVLQAANAVASGQVDVCIAMGALMDLSYWECKGFRTMGAMGSDRFADDPAAASRPFDRDRNGFIYGESCGVVVVERADLAQKRAKSSYANIAGWAMGMDKNRNPNPSFEGEVRVIELALAQAGIEPSEIDYINPHGTGSTIGDEIELEAISHCGLSHAHINATKSIAGHGLTSAGAIEVIATLLQMKAGQLHPSRNLFNPMSNDYNWVQHQAKTHQIKHAVTMSMGFGGVSSALCLSAV